MDNNAHSASRTLELLTGPPAGRILAAAMAAVDAEVVQWRPHQVDHQPRSGSTAAYRVRVRWPDGHISEERLAVYTGRPPKGALVVGNGAEQVAVWRFPHDPYLPALASAMNPDAVASLLRSFGLGDGPVRLVLRAYRPRRRAVVEAVGPAGRLFLKVVRPSRVEPLHRRHRLLTGAGVPAPPSLGYTPEGLLVLQVLPGRTLREVLGEGEAALPSGASILALLDRLPEELLQAPERRSRLARADHYASVVANVLPDRAEQIRQLGAAITAEAGTGPVVPVHGDFYENQIRVDQGRITGLLDIDTAGPGDRLDDLGCLLGHLSVLSQLDPARASAINQAGSRYLGVFERSVDPADLRYWVAAVVLSLATGPYRVQEPGWEQATRARLDLVEQWVNAARAVSRRG
jgi:aminoglycoside phosphotransferase